MALDGIIKSVKDESNPSTSAADLTDGNKLTGAKGKKKKKNKKDREKAAAAAGAGAVGTNDIKVRLFYVLSRPSPGAPGH